MEVDALAHWWGHDVDSVTVTDVDVVSPGDRLSVALPAIGASTATCCTAPSGATTAAAPCPRAGGPVSGEAAALDEQIGLAPRPAVDRARRRAMTFGHEVGPTHGDMRRHRRKDDTMTTTDATVEALPNGTHRSLRGEWHGVPDDDLAPVLTEFFQE